MRVVLRDIYKKELKEGFFSLQPRGSDPTITRSEAEQTRSGLSWLQPDPDAMNKALEATGLTREKLYQRIKGSWKGGKQGFAKLNPLVKTGIYLGAGIPGALFRKTVGKVSTGAIDLATKIKTGLTDPLSGQYLKARPPTPYTTRSTMGGGFRRGFSSR